MEQLPFDTFRIKALEDNGLTKVPKQLYDYYRTRRQGMIFGFIVMKPVTIVELVQQCYMRPGGGDFQKDDQTSYAIVCKEYQHKYTFEIFL